MMGETFSSMKQIIRKKLRGIRNIHTNLRTAHQKNYFSVITLTLPLKPPGLLRVRKRRRAGCLRFQAQPLLDPKPHQLETGPALSLPRRGGRSFGGGGIRGRLPGARRSCASALPPASHPPGQPAPQGWALTGCPSS